MDYPYLPDYIRLNKRDMVWLNRKQAAWNLVHHKFDEVTDEEFDRAFDLMARCIRYALASYRLFESETELNCNDPSRKRKEEQLWKRMERLNKELAYYDARLNGQVWPQVVDIDRHHNVVVAYLYDFD